jgi:hypothetical protein
LAAGKNIFNLLLLTGILVFLSFPALQNILHLKKEIKPLKGAYYEKQDTVLNLRSWLTGRYQEKKDDYVNQEFGFRNYYVRLNNQLDMELFNKSNAAKVVIGKGGFLYEVDYIEAYFGKNFVGKDLLTERFKKLKELQEILSAQGILLEVILSPGKASFYPEFIPKEWTSKKQLSNYEFAASLCKYFKIDYIDFNAWFVQQKDFSLYDLYPKTGIHWSNYGSLIAMDSLRKHIEKRTGLNLRDIVINNVSFSDTLRNPDEDIGEAMNLLWNIPPLPMPYANYSWGDEGNPVKPKALFIGDSYFWNIYYEGLTNNIFSDCKFWYYNQTVFPESEPERDVKKLDLIDEIRKNQVIVIMATESNVHDIGWGFIDQAYDAFKNKLKDVARRKMYLQVLKEKIHNTPQWMSDIGKKAKEKNISVEEMVNLDAQYIYETDYCQPDVIAATEEIKIRIHNTPAWTEDVRKKAKEKNITFEEMLELDAKFIYEQEKNKK